MPNKLEKLAHPENAAVVTPHDTNNLANAGVLYVGTGGHVAVTTAGGNDVIFTNVGDGGFLPVFVSKVRTTGTTAANILVLY